MRLDVRRARWLCRIAAAHGAGPDRGGSDRRGAAQLECSRAVERRSCARADRAQARRRRQVVPPNHKVPIGLPRGCDCLAQGRRSRASPYAVFMGPNFSVAHYEGILGPNFFRDILRGHLEERDPESPSTKQLAALRRRARPAVYREGAHVPVRPVSTAPSYAARPSWGMVRLRPYRCSWTSPQPLLANRQPR